MNYESEVYFDGANGVGVITMKNAYGRLADKIKVNFYNDEVGAPGKLNYKVSAKAICLLQHNMVQLK